VTKLSQNVPWLHGQNDFKMCFCVDRKSKIAATTEAVLIKASWKLIQPQLVTENNYYPVKVITW
jgi:hypothetical protein